MPKGKDISLDVGMRIAEMCADGCNPRAVHAAMCRSTGDGDIQQMVGLIEDLFYGKIKIGALKP